jgi:integrase
MADTIKPQKVLLTDAVLKKLRFEQRVIGMHPDGSLITVDPGPRMTDWFLGDSKMPGFLVRVTGKGLRFYAQRKLAGRPCRFDCGAFPGTSLTKARESAGIALGYMRAGKDPNLVKKQNIAEVKAERIKAKQTVGFMFANDAKTQSETDAHSTKRDRKDVQKWLEDLPVWRTPIHELTPDILDEMMSSVKETRGSATSVKVWRYLRAAWNRLDSTEQPDRDPFADRLKKHKLPVIPRRQTVLHTDDESGQAWLQAIAPMRDLAGGRNFAKRVMADYIILTLCWGARRSEAASLKVSDVNFEREYIVFRDTKNARDHYFPLTPGVAAILRRRIEDNNMPRGRDVRKALKGEATYIPEWVFPSPKRGVPLVEPRAALDLGQAAAGMRITMHDLRRSFAGEVAADVLVDEDGNKKGDFGLVKIAMNHADIMSDVTQGYIMVRPRLKMLRPIYLAHERRVLKAAGLDDLLPPEKSDVDKLVAELKRKLSDDPAALRKILDTLASESKS